MPFYKQAQPARHVDLPAPARRSSSISRWAKSGATLLLSAILALSGGVLTAEAAIRAPSTQVTQVPTGTAPFAAAFNPNNGYVYVVNAADNSLTAINGATRAVVGVPIPTGGVGPGAIAFNPSNGYLYVTNERSDTVSVINPATNTLVGGPIPVGTYPNGVAVDPTTGFVYVTAGRSDSVYVLNGATNTVVATIAVGARPLGIAYSPASGSLYVANNTANTVSVIKASSGTVVATIPTPTSPYRLAYNPNNGNMYLTNQVGGSVSVISSTTNTIVGSPILIPQYTPSGIVFHPAGNGLLYVTNQGSSSVSVIDGSTNTVVGSPISVGPVPIGITFDSNTGLIYVANLGNNTASVLAAPPVITSGTPTNATVTVPYSFTVTANGAPSTITFSVSAGSLPPGLSLNGTTGEISGTATSPGSYTFTISASNGVSPNATATYSMTSFPAVAPTITSGPPSNGAQGAAYSHTVTASGTGPISYSVTSGTLPNGLTLDSTTGTISGTPTTGGSFTFAVAATNVAGLDSKTYTVDIVTAPIITSPPPANGTTGVAYSHTVTATGTGPITFSISSGSLPNGLTLNPTTGVISGTPTTAGPFSFQVSATNTAGSDTKNYSLAIVAAPVITTTSIPDATAGIAYSQTITATGSGPITFALASGSALPAGLTLDPTTGAISGTPTTSGSFTFTVTATNATGTDSRAYTVTVTAAAITPTPTPTPPSPSLSPSVPAAKTGSSKLAITGSNGAVAPLLAGSGMVLLAIGAGTLVRTRKRHQS